MLVLVIVKFLISDILPTVADVLEHVSFFLFKKSLSFTDKKNFEDFI